MRIKKITVHFIAILDLTMFISQQYKHQNKARNIFKINNQTTRETSYVCLYLLTLNIFYSHQYLLVGSVLFPIFSVNNYLFKVNNRNTRIMCEMWTPEQRYVAIKKPERNAGWVATS